MKPSSTVRTIFALAIAALVFTGCEDPFGPEDWVAIPDTVDLFSLGRAEYQGLPSAFDLLSGFNGQRVSVETPGASGNWDFVLTESNGKLHLSPSGVVKDLVMGAGIAPLTGVTFESVTKVPGAAARYQDTASVPLEEGMVYAVRSRRYFGIAGESCVSYGKLAPIEIDHAAGVLRFEIIRNPNCNDRSMIPPK